MNMYSDLSYRLTKELHKDIKKNQGIFFTPPRTIINNINEISSYMNNIHTILEPSCGSCEFITYLHKNYPNTSITGIEYNEEIYDKIKIYNNDKINIIKRNFLTFETNEKYDLIIGNPPYFVIHKSTIDKEYYEYFDGRPNIFILFIIKSLKMLNNNGIFNFVLPKSFLNCLYYDKTRQYIFDNFYIINILECYDKYIDTSQETITLIVQKRDDELDTIHNNNLKFTINKYKFCIFGTQENILKLHLLYENSKSLHSLNFKVNVGNIVWNQNKAILTDDNTKTRLIYSSDIKNNQLIFKKYSNSVKKNYIDKEGNTCPTLTINRGYGVGNYNFEYCLIDGEFEYLIENHLICINYSTDIDKNELITLYRNIITSLNDERTKEFIKIYFGNSAINTTELNYILPIYL